MSGKLAGTGHIRLRRRPILRVERFDEAFRRKYRRSSFVTFIEAESANGHGTHAVVRNGARPIFRLNPGQYLITYPTGEQIPMDAWMVHAFFYPVPAREEARHGEQV